MINILNEQKQAQLLDEILKERLDTVMKEAMIESEIDTWLIPSREYCEDPLFKLLTPALFLTARRLSIIILHLEGDKVGKYCCNMPDSCLESIYTNIYTDKNQDQLTVLNDFLLKIKPQKIGIDISDNYAYFDGLSKALYDCLLNRLDKELITKLTSAEKLGIRYCEKRSSIELQHYPNVVEIAQAIIEKAFSKDFIKPGITTTEDVEWYMKQMVKDAGLTYWFSPDVNLQNAKSDSPMQNGIINKGDLLHCDFGLTYLNLHTDTQRLAYVLKDNETELPPAISAGYQQNMHFHEIVKKYFKEGLSGNEILLKALEEGKKEGLQPMLYTHPLGLFGHAPGPTIGLFSAQEEVHPSGDLQVHDATAYALELNTKAYVETYNKEIYFFTEESVIFKNNELSYLCKPKGIYLI